MITLEKACEIYEAFCRWPIECIVENDTEWAFFFASDTFMRGVNIPVVNKEAGNISEKLMFEYYNLPEVKIPERFIKPLPKVEDFPFSSLSEYFESHETPVTRISNQETACTEH